MVRSLLISSILFHLISCDFSHPHNNALLNYDEPIILHDLESLNIFIIDSNYMLDSDLNWVVKDLSKSVKYSLLKNKFEITISHKEDGRAKVVFIDEKYLPASYS